MAFAYGFAVAGKVLGVNYALKHITPQHGIGQISYDSRGRKWVYVKANGTIGGFKMVRNAAASDPFTNVVIAVASAATSMVIGISPLALSAGDYAWIIKEGIVEDDA